MNKAFNKEDSDSSSEEEEDKQDKQKGPRQAKRPNNKKFQELMKDTQAFPSLDEADAQASEGEGEAEAE